MLLSSAQMLEHIGLRKVIYKKKYSNLVCEKHPFNSFLTISVFSFTYEFMRSIRLFQMHNFFSTFDTSLRKLLLTFIADLNNVL